LNTSRRELSTDYYFRKPVPRKSPDLVVEKVACGSLGMADVGEGPRDDDPVQARQDTGDLLGMSFDEVDHGQLRARG
jgi:hypothetical protein